MQAFAEFYINTASFRPVAENTFFCYNCNIFCVICKPLSGFFAVFFQMNRLFFEVERGYK